MLYERCPQTLPTVELLAAPAGAAHAPTFVPAVNENVELEGGMLSSMRTWSLHDSLPPWLQEMSTSRKTVSTAPAAGAVTAAGASADGETVADIDALLPKLSDAVALLDGDGDGDACGATITGKATPRYCFIPTFAETDMYTPPGTLAG